MTRPQAPVAELAQQGVAGAVAMPRRQVLRMLTLSLAVPALAGTVGACAGPSAPDPLLALAAAARADSALIEATTRLHSRLAAAVGPVAAARRAHATALEQEIARLDPEPPAASSPPAPTTRLNDQKAALDAVLQALAGAAKQAADAAPELPGHRAALVGSIAACCAGYRAVLG